MSPPSDVTLTRPPPTPPFEPPRVSDTNMSTEIQPELATCLQPKVKTAKGIMTDTCQHFTEAPKDQNRQIYIERFERRQVSEQLFLPMHTIVRETHVQPNQILRPGTVSPAGGSTRASHVPTWRLPSVPAAEEACKGIWKRWK